MNISTRLIGAAHQPELDQLLFEVGESCGLHAGSYPTLNIRQYLDLCRQAETTRVRTIKPIPTGALAAKVRKHEGTEIYALINELAMAFGQHVGVYDNSTTAAALNKLTKPQKKKKRR